MNDDALAAVIAAAELLLKRAVAGSAVPRGSRWALAARMRTADVERARRAAACASRWKLGGRLDG